MKKVLFATLALIMLNIGSAFALITITISIGKPPAPTCPGFGFCGITVSRMASHTLAVGKDGQSLIMTIDANTLKHDQPDKLVYLEGKKSVTLEKGLNLPDDVVRALKEKGQITIEPGKCPVSYSAGVYTVTLAFRRNKPMMEK